MKRATSSRTQRISTKPIVCDRVFFFSSRRRHTRLQGDWSSDVCSSDLRPRGGSLRCIVHAEAGPQAVHAVAQMEEVPDYRKRKKSQSAEGENRRDGKEIGRASCRERV